MIEQIVIEYKDILFMNEDIGKRNKDGWILDYVNTVMIQHLVGGSQLIYLTIYSKKIQEELENGTR